MLKLIYFIDFLKPRAFSYSWAWKVIVSNFLKAKIIFFYSIFNNKIESIIFESIVRSNAKLFRLPNEIFLMMKNSLITAYL